VNWDDVRKALQSDDVEERRRAASRLSEDRGDLPAELVLAAFGDGDWRVRKEATQAVTSRAPDTELIRVLVSAFRPGDNVGQRNAAVDALAAFGAHAVGPLAAELGALDADGRKLVVDTLAKAARPEALPVLRALLRDPEVNVRSAAVEAIAAIGESCAEDAIALLDTCLDSDDRFQRLAALAGLNQLSAVLPWERLEPLLEDPMLVPAALVAAGRSAAEPAADIVVRELERARGHTWDDALTALVELASSSPAARARTERALGDASSETRARILVRAASDEEPPERRHAALRALALVPSAQAATVAVATLADDALAGEAEVVLQELGSVAVPALVEGTSAASPEERAACVELLGPLARIDPDAGRAVERALVDESPEVVAAALAALAEAGKSRSLTLVAKLLVPGASPLVHQAAQRALGVLARRHPGEARELARAVSPSSDEVEAALVIAEALSGPVRGSVEADVAFMSAALANEHGSVRRAALSALATLGGAPALEPIEFALSDEEPDVRLAAVRSLGRLRGEDGVALGLERLLSIAESSGEAALVAAAARSLGEIKDPRVLPALRVLAKGEARVAVAAVEAVGDSDDPKKSDILIEALAHVDSEVVKVALRALSAERDPRAVAHLGACLDHAAWDVRRLAAELLGGIGNDAALGLLRSRLVSEEEPLVRDALGYALVEAETSGGRRMTAPPPSLGGRRPR
jgi:HEAT repeat protein